MYGKGVLLGENVEMDGPLRVKGGFDQRRRQRNGIQTLVDG